MSHEFSRTEMLLGQEGVARLQNAKVAVFGVGGVGTFAIEALVRSGVATLDLFDSDEVCLSNFNRQLIATTKNLGKSKVEAMQERIAEINPKANVSIHQTFYSAENAKEIDLAVFDYVVDAIDTVSSKLLLIEEAKKAGTPIISSMGAGNKLDPTKFAVADIAQTTMCPLAKVIRSELRKRGIAGVKVVYSTEPALTPHLPENVEKDDLPPDLPPHSEIKTPIKRQTPGSISFVPSVAGLILAGEVIKDLAGVER